MEMKIRMDTLTDSQLQLNGINALKEKLGVVNTLKFLQQFDNGGSGDYTVEKYMNEDNKMSKEELLELMK